AVLRRDPHDVARQRARAHVRWQALADIHVDIDVLARGGALALQPFGDLVALLLVDAGCSTLGLILRLAGRLAVLPGVARPCTLIALLLALSLLLIVLFLLGVEGLSVLPLLGVEGLSVLLLLRVEGLIVLALAEPLRRPGLLR